MTWSKYVNISMPSPKHILETIKAAQAKGKLKVSVVEKAVADDAVKAIGQHVKAHGWTSGGAITIEWMDGENDQCYKIIYKGNEWRTHSNSGQLWPVKGPDVFSPAEGSEAVAQLIKKWKSTKTRPNQHFNQ